MDKIKNYLFKLPDKILHFGASFAVEIALALAHKRKEQLQ